MLGGHAQDSYAGKCRRPRHPAASSTLLTLASLDMGPRSGGLRSLSRFASSWMPFGTGKRFLPIFAHVSLASVGPEPRTGLNLPVDRVSCTHGTSQLSLYRSSCCAFVPTVRHCVLGMAPDAPLRNQGDLSDCVLSLLGFSPDFFVHLFVR